MGKKYDKIITSLDVVNIPKLSVAADSIEAQLIGDEYIDKIFMPSRGPITVSQVYGSAEDYRINFGTSSLEEIRVPQLDDIESVSKNIYYENGIAKARVTIRIRNSSGQKLKGIDARQEIDPASGGIL
jgi:hypothetical protein